MRDFDLVRADRSLEPLEITLAADEPTLQTWARVEALDRDCPALKRAWTLSVPTTWPDTSGKPGPFDARDFRLAAEPLLSELERLGISDFDTARWTPDPGPAENVIEQLVALGCDLGMSHELADGELGRIYLGSE